VKQRILTLVVVAQFLIIAAVFAAKPASSTPTPVPAHCPRIHDAVHALDVALEEMNHAGHDFCGRKAEALDATRHARELLHRAEDCDRCR
jgi:hypothetical protein